MLQKRQRELLRQSGENVLDEGQPSLACFTGDLGFVLGCKNRQLQRVEHTQRSAESVIVKGEVSVDDAGVDRVGYGDGDGHGEKRVV